MTESKYGDYQLDLDGLENTIDVGTDQIYGVLSARKKAMTMVCVMWKISGAEQSWHGQLDLQHRYMDA